MTRRLMTLFAVWLGFFCGLVAVSAQELSEQRVLETIQVAKKALLLQQQPDGTWPMDGLAIIGEAEMKPGATALVTLALLNCGMTPDDREVRAALKFLRECDLPKSTYVSSLHLMVLAMVKDRRDFTRMQLLVERLESSQVQSGDKAGTWDYGIQSGLLGGDSSNGQYAVLALYEAAHAGIKVKRQTWEKSREYWRRIQTPDGGWPYGPGQNSTGSMTVAGIASMVMTSAMLQDDKDVDAKGNVNCCRVSEPDTSIERGRAWLTSHFQVGSNPANSNWLFYYLYGLERAGRLSGQRFFGEHDWYRRGAEFLVRGLDKRINLWTGQGGERDPVLSTSFALLFLSKGLAPVLINKLKYDSVAGKDEWNLHPFEVRNLTDRISGADRWPKLVTWQTVDLNSVTKHGGVNDLKQAPVLYLCGGEAPKFTDQEIDLLKQYVNFGGFILAVNTCNKVAFREGVTSMVQRMYPKGEASLEKLKPEHPIYRAEYPIDGKALELWGADLGCRTSIVYSPEDIACLWNKWSRLEPEKRHIDVKTRVERAMKLGVNIVAYATGREPPTKLGVETLANEDGKADNVKRGLLQVAQVRHAGGWDTAPKAARNLLLAVNRTAGLTATTQPGTLTLSEPTLAEYSLLVMHGRNRFEIAPAEATRLRDYLARGRVLFADACCGATQFDRSFRAFCEQVYPEHKLQRIPPEHEVFFAGHEIKKVRRRTFDSADINRPLEGNVVEGEPFLEGIEVDGRYVVIYSKFDISCALERQASLACAGYVPEDATKLAVNIVMYTLQQDLNGATKAP